MSTSGAPRSLRVHGCAAVLVYAVDSFLFAQGVVTGVAMLAMVLLGLVGVVRGLGADRRYIRSGLAIIAIYSLTMAAVVATIRVNNRIAHGRAEEVIAALEQYKAQTGDYPVQLAELVPRYLPAVPRAKYTLTFNAFQYHYDPSRHQGSLSYVDLPPFGRPTYRLHTDSWGYLD